MKSNMKTNYTLAQSSDVKIFTQTHIHTPKVRVSQTGEKVGDIVEGRAKDNTNERQPA